MKTHGSKVKVNYPDQTKATQAIIRQVFDNYPGKVIMCKFDDNGGYWAFLPTITDCVELYLSIGWSRIEDLFQNLPERGETED